MVSWINNFLASTAIHSKWFHIYEIFCKNFWLLAFPSAVKHNHITYSHVQSVAEWFMNLVVHTWSLVRHYYKMRNIFFLKSAETIVQMMTNDGKSSFLQDIC